MTVTPTAPPSTSAPVFTVGHGTLSADAFAALLHEHGVTHLVDIRSFPGSRTNPQFGRDTMAAWLPEHGITYSWAPDLGGRRKPVPDTRHTAWQNASFAAYADHMETPTFRAAISELLDVAARERCAVMCSETVWWRCHRRLVADHLTLVEHLSVRHLMPTGTPRLHSPTPWVRLYESTLVYDVTGPVDAT